MTQQLLLQHLHQQQQDQPQPLKHLQQLQEIAGSVLVVLVALLTMMDFSSPILTTAIGTTSVCITLMTPSVSGPLKDLMTVGTGPSTPTRLPVLGRNLFQTVSRKLQL